MTPNPPSGSVEEKLKELERLAKEADILPGLIKSHSKPKECYVELPFGDDFMAAMHYQDFLIATKSPVVLALVAVARAAAKVLEARKPERREMKMIGALSKGGKHMFLTGPEDLIELDSALQKLAEIP